MTQLILVKELFQICFSNDYQFKKLTFSPDVEGYNSNYLFFGEHNSIEVIIFKSTIKKIFIECHEVFNNNIPFDICEFHLNFFATGLMILTSTKLAKYQENELVELYYMTIGIFLITNENHTALNIHDQIITYILSRSQNEPFANLLLDPRTFLGKELAIIELLLNSNNNKLNKSSSYWHIYKKLMIQNHNSSLHNGQGFELHRFINTTIRSCELHPTNYYAWNFMRWLYKYTTFYNLENSTIIPKIESFCYKNTNDAAAWSCLGDVLTFSWDVQKLESYRFELEKLGTNTKNVKPIQSNNSDFVLSKLDHLTNWIIDHQITSIVPYQSIKQVLSYLITNSALERSLGYQKLIDQTKQCEKCLSAKGIKYTIKNGFNELNVNLDDDLILSNQIQCHINCVRTLKWVDQLNNKHQSL